MSSDYNVWIENCVYGSVVMIWNGILLAELNSGLWTVSWIHFHVDMLLSKAVASHMSLAGFVFITLPCLIHFE